MNVKLLRKVKRHILTEPRRLDMNSIGERSSKAPCGTAACIAGWASVLSASNPKITYNYYGELIVNGIIFHWDAALKALDLQPDERDRLCREPKFALKDRPYEECWPVSFAKKYEAARSAKQRARVTAARIEHFIKTKGRE